MYRYIYIYIYMYIYIYIYVEICVICMLCPGNTNYVHTKMKRAFSWGMHYLLQFFCSRNGIVKAEHGSRPSKVYFPTARDTPRLGENLNPEYSSSIESASLSFAVTTFCAVESVWEQSKNIGKQDSRKLLAQWFGSNVRCIVTLFGFCIRKHGIWKEGFGSGKMWNNLKNQFSVVVDTIKCKRNKIRHQKEHSRAQTLLYCAHILHIMLVIDQFNAQILIYNKFIIFLYTFRHYCAHHQEVNIVLHSICYHHTL